ncbi:MAG: wax ester/triacylglycerol synthase family O-acyltransferase, partial [Candidatus Dormibacteraeota bacterium]|nr:wax ester/triacylglycerol synthase family O-acyltransferase [Candidatus Dormibacteraeota bacterium]
MDRMNPLDASFIHVEDDNNPMHIGSVVVLEGPPPTYGDMVRLIAGKLALVPRYRQKVREVPFGLGRPVWVDDPHFQILYHIRHTAVPSPGSEEQLRNLAGRVFAQLLDRRKPLWEMWVVEGLEGGRWALISKVHHAMVDGMAGTDLMTVLLDSRRDTEPMPAAPPVAASEPSDLHLVADALADAIVSPLDRVTGLRVVARAGLPTLPELVENLRGLAGTWLQPAATSLNGPIGPHRRWSWAKAELADVKLVREGLGGTVNDVILAAITAGFRALLLARGERVEGRVVRTLVPVSMRARDERGVLDNQVSGLFPGLPVGVADPVERLRLVRSQMEDLKRSRVAVGGDALVKMGGFAPEMLLALGARLGTRAPQRAVQTVTTNVPGPQVPLYAAGRQLLEAYPYVPIAGNVRIAIAIFSYIGRLKFGVTGDYDTSPYIDVLC